MSPERHFGQIEEVLSESLIKIDRIEDLATKTFGLAETAHTNGETTARAVASLTIENQQAHQQMNDKLDTIQDDITDLKNGQQQIMNFLREKFS